MGVTVRQKAKGRGQPWWIFVHHQGRLRSKKIGDRRAAEAVASELRKKLKGGELDLSAQQCKPKDDSPLFRDYARQYLNDYAKVACKWTTWTGYEQLLKDHILPALGSLKMRAITRRDIKRLLLAKANEGLAPATVQNIQVLISGIFTHAYEDEIIQAHPALKMGRYIGRRDRRIHVNAVTGDQVRDALATCRTKFPDWYTFMLTAFRTGMRLGELLGLAWEDVDLVARQIEVRRGYSHGRFSTPKSHKSRYVDMSDQLAQSLSEHRRAMQARFGTLPATQVPIARGGHETVHLIFPNGQGGPSDGDNFRRRVFTRLIEQAGLPRMRFHDVRHTFASLLLQNGESLHYVKEQMGHASIQTTVDVYGHLVPGSNRNAVNRLDDVPDAGSSLLLTG